MFTAATTNSSFAATPKNQQTPLPFLLKASWKLKTPTMRRTNQAVNSFASARRNLMVGIGKIVSNKMRLFQGSQSKDRLAQVSRLKETN